MQVSRLLASTGIRLSLIYSALLVASFAMAIALTWIAAKSSAEKDLRNRIMLEVDALEAEVRDEGIGPATAAIQARVARPGALDYWLVGSEGGNILGGEPAPAGLTGGWQRIDVPDPERGAGKKIEMLVFTAAMPDGSRLSVGDDPQRAEAIRDAVLRALLIIGTATVGLGVCAGILAIRRSLGQMDALTTTMSEVAAGRLDMRFVPRTARLPNDLDQLGIRVNQMLDHIDSLVQSLKRVSRDVAHDLRTPLSHVRQRLEEAKVARSGVEQHAAIERAEDQIAEILRAFDAILRLSEIEAGQSRAHFSDIDAARLIERVADAYRPDIESGQRTLAVDYVEASHIHGDADLLAQALANLLENSMRHTPPGTHISLSCSSVDGIVRLQVADSGGGIPMDRRSESLQPFVRLDSSRGNAGFGLGLSIVTAIARLHGASLDLDDASPGLRVTLGFPPTESAG